MSNIIKSFKTIKMETETQFTEKKSVFTARAKSVRTEEALAFIASVRERHSGATHNCYAYVLRENSVLRFSDDGEPSSTAGVPILNVIQKNGLTDTAVVVTRYFGGILLGASGLVRAYSAAANNIIDSAGIAEYTEFIEFSIKCSYSDYNKISKTLEAGGIITDSILYEENITVRAAVKEGEYEKLGTLVTNLTNGHCKAEETGRRFDLATE